MAELQNEAVRGRMQREYLAGKVQVDGAAAPDRRAAYLRSIELAAPHRLQQARNLCADCIQARLADWQVFLG